MSVELSRKTLAVALMLLAGVPASAQRTHTKGSKSARSQAVSHAAVPTPKSRQTEAQPVVPKDAKAQLSAVERETARTVKSGQKPAASAGNVSVYQESKGSQKKPAAAGSHYRHAKSGLGANHSHSSQGSRRGIRRRVSSGRGY